MKPAKPSKWIGHLVMAVFLAVAGLAVPAQAATPDNGAIDAKYRSLGGASGWLGDPINALRCGLTAGGCVRSYEHGIIYWVNVAGAHPVKGAIGTKWIQMGYELSPLGYPKSDEICSGSGTTRTCTQYFLGGNIRWSSGKVVAVTPIQASIGVLVNKRNPNRPINYVPPDLQLVGNQYMRREAARQMAAFLGAARNAGIAITTVSGYRSYSTQQSVYNSYVASYGQAYADTISARPGYSEHQTGLAIDIGNPNGQCSLLACFASTPAGRYAANNAWRYGFIIRYPNGYDSTTGYTYEPWHLRYVGSKVAADMRYRGYPTLESYYGQPAAPRY